jgi:hypothetical protein
VKETFFSVSTPLSFLDRFTKKDGMKDLIEVLSKWNKGECCLKENGFCTTWMILTCSLWHSDLHSAQARASVSSGWNVYLWRTRHGLCALWWVYCCACERWRSDWARNVSREGRKIKSRAMSGRRWVDVFFIQNDVVMSNQAYCSWSESDKPFLNPRTGQLPSYTKYISKKIKSDGWIFLWKPHKYVQ